MSAAVNQSSRRKSTPRAWDFSLDTLKDWKTPVVGGQQAEPLASLRQPKQAERPAQPNPAPQAANPARTAPVAELAPRSGARRNLTPHRGSPAPTLPMALPRSEAPAAPSATTARPRRTRMKAWEFSWSDTPPATEAHEVAVASPATVEEPAPAPVAATQMPPQAVAELLSEPTAPDITSLAPMVVVPPAAPEPQITAPEQAPVARRKRGPAERLTSAAEAAMSEVKASVSATLELVREAKASVANQDAVQAPQADRSLQQALRLAQHVLRLRAERQGLRARLVAEIATQTADQVARQVNLERQLSDIRHKLSEEAKGRGETLRQLTTIEAELSRERTLRTAAEDRANLLGSELSQTKKSLAEAITRAAQPVPASPFASPSQAGASRTPANPEEGVPLDPAHVFRRLGGAEMKLSDSTPAMSMQPEETSELVSRRGSKELVQIHSTRPGVMPRTVQVVRLPGTGAGPAAPLPDTSMVRATGSSGVRHSRQTLSLYRGNPETILARSEEREQMQAAERPNGAAAPLLRSDAEQAAHQQQRARERMARDPLIIEAVRAVTLLRQLDKPDATTPEAGQKLGEVLASLRRRLSGVEMKVLANSASKAMG